jgi:hypothetical protein
MNSHFGRSDIGMARKILVSPLSVTYKAVGSMLLLGIGIAVDVALVYYAGTHVYAVVVPKRVLDSLIESNELKLKIFEEIGIPVPHLKLVSSEVAGASGPHPHVSKLAFVGVTENDLKKIRGWLVRNEIQRRK